MKKLVAVVLLLAANHTFGQCTSEGFPKADTFTVIEAQVADTIFPESRWTKVDGALKSSRETADKVPLCAYVKNSITTTRRGTYKCLIAYFTNVNTYRKKCLVWEFQYEFNAPLTKSRPVVRIAYWADTKGKKYKKSVISFSRKWYAIAPESSQEILARFVAAHK